MYTPNADHPYSLPSFLRRPLNDSGSSSLAPPAWERLDHDQLKFLFCVLESSFVVLFALAFLHVCEFRNKGAQVVRPGTLVVLPSVIVCILLENACDLRLFFEACIAKL